MKENEKQLLSLAMETWGEEAQIGMLHEEIGELLQAINKFRRNMSDDNHKNVCEEIADVEIMLDQMKILVGETFVLEWRHIKLKRLKEKLTK
jgi:NTP pyrophosphatase (non-canonical NTP hydrolase)